MVVVGKVEAGDGFGTRRARAAGRGGFGTMTSVARVILIRSRAGLAVAHHVRVRHG